MPETNFASNFAETYQEVFSKKMRYPLRPKNLLREFVNTEFEGDLKDQGDEVDVFTVPDIKGSHKKKSDTNFYEKIPRQSGTPTKEKLKVDQVHDFNVAMTLHDQRISSIPALAEKYAANIRKNFEESVVEADILSNFVFTPTDNIISGASTTVNGAVIAGATTITFASAADFTAGDIFFFTDTNGDTGAALVKSIATNTITIEDDEANFPSGLGNEEFFYKLVTALPAIADGSVIKGDKPISLTKSNVHDYLIDLRTKIIRSKVGASDLFAHAMVDAFSLLAKDSATPVKNDFLGKDVIVNGEIKRGAGMDLLASAVGLARSVSSVNRFYMLVAKKKYSLHFVDYLSTVAVDRVQETGGMVYTHSGYDIYQSHAFRQGRKGLSLLSFTI